MGCLASKERRVVPVNDKAIVRNENESSSAIANPRDTVSEVSGYAQSTEAVVQERKGREQSYKPTVMRPKTRCIMVRRAEPSSTVDNTTSEAATSGPSDLSVHAPTTEEKITEDFASSRMSMISDSDSMDGSCYEEREIPDLVVRGKRLLPPLPLRPLASVPISGGLTIKKVPPPLPKLRVVNEGKAENGTSFPSLHTINARSQNTSNVKVPAQNGVLNYCSALWSRSDEDVASPEPGAALFDSIGRIIAKF